MLGGRGEEKIGLACEDLTGRAIGLAIKVHKALGPGLYEQVYEDCPCHEFERNGLRYTRQAELPLIYEGVRFPRTYRADIVAEETIILEIKSIEQILQVHESQILTCLRLSGCRIGLLLNFNTVLLKNGLRASSKPLLRALRAEWNPSPPRTPGIFLHPSISTNTPTHPPISEIARPPGLRINTNPLSAKCRTSRSAVIRAIVSSA